MLDDLTAAAKADMIAKLQDRMQLLIPEARAKWAAGNKLRWEPTTTLDTQKAFEHLHGRLLGIIEAANEMALPMNSLWALLPEDWFDPQTTEPGPTDPTAP